MGGKTGEWGGGPAGATVLMMSVGCMQRRVQFGQRRAEQKLNPHRRGEQK